MNLAAFSPRHFKWDFESGIGTVTLDRPQRKNPLTFDSYSELRDLFRDLVYAREIKVVIVTGSGGNFCSGGDVHEIIGPLTKMDMAGLLNFTRMTGDLVKAMRSCPQPVISAVDGVCAGAGAIIAMASDIRIATARTKTAFLFTRVGLAGCDMGACAILPRVIGQGRASELLFSGRAMTADEGDRWGFYNRIVAHEELMSAAMELAKSLAAGPTWAHGITKTQLNAEWAVSLDVALEMEAQAQAICMQTQDFRRAYEAFVARQPPNFEGN
jgi:enoyl-CoA hydratase/carnithine racemase